MYLVPVFPHVLYVAPGHVVQAEHVTGVVGGVGQFRAAATHQELGVHKGGHVAPPTHGDIFTSILHLHII